MKIHQYFVSDEKRLENGALQVDWCGEDGDRLTTGVYDVSPGSLDYKFWLWLTQRLKHRWYQFGARPGLDEQAISKYRSEYEDQCANKRMH